MPAGGSARHGSIGYAPEELFAAAGDQVPRCRARDCARGRTEYGVVRRYAGGCAPRGPSAKGGEFIALELMESRFEENESIETSSASWICYQAMADLTGLVPSTARRSRSVSATRIRSGLRRNPIILNSDYVGSTMDDFERGIVSSVGYEMGRLRRARRLVRWNGPAAGVQSDSSSVMPWRPSTTLACASPGPFRLPTTPAPDTSVLLPGRELVERFFVRFGDAYLADRIEAGRA